MNLGSIFVPSGELLRVHSIAVKAAGDVGVKRVQFAFKSAAESPESGGLVVEGILAAEQVDFEGEVMDYKTSKPNFQKWNARSAEASGGKSLGALRGQHDPKIAAGKFIAMEYDDTRQVIPCTAVVVDPIEADKVREGVYTSFSIGAHYVRKWRDGQHTRWTADPFEGSLVDFGSIPGTRGFTYRTADGAVKTIHGGAR